MALCKQCEYCGANLDHGERCDCRQEDTMSFDYEYIEECITAIIRDHPNLSASGIGVKMCDIYGKKLSVDNVRRVIGRMTSFSGLKETKSTTGVITYYFPKEA